MLHGDIVVEFVELGSVLQYFRFYLLLFQSLLLNFQCSEIFKKLVYFKYFYILENFNPLGLCANALEDVFGMAT